MESRLDWRPGRFQTTAIYCLCRSPHFSRRLRPITSFLYREEMVGASRKSDARVTSNHGKQICRNLSRRVGPMQIAPCRDLASADEIATRSVGKGDEM